MPPPPGAGWPVQPAPVPPGGWQPQPQAPGAQKNNGCLKIGLIVAGIFVVLGILGVGCIALTANEVAKEIDSAVGEADEGDYDLTGPECSVDDILGPQATGEITNTSSERQGFQITVRFVADDGSLVSEDSAFTDTLDIGQSTDWKVTTLEEAAGEVTCELTEVSYTIFDDQE